MDITLEVGPVTLLFSRAGSAAWPDPAHRLVSLHVNGNRLVYGVCGYLSDYRVSGGPWAWAGKAHGGEIQYEDPIVDTSNPLDKGIETSAVLLAPNLEGVFIPVARRHTVHRLVGRGPRMVEYSHVDVVTALADHEQRVEYLDMMPLTRQVDQSRAWFGWAAGTGMGEIPHTSTTSSTNVGDVEKISVGGPHAHLVQQAWHESGSVRGRVVDRPNTLKLYSVGLDAQALGDSIRSVPAGSTRISSARWSLLF